jgi:hypothetical protein
MSAIPLRLCGDGPVMERSDAFPSPPSFAMLMLLPRSQSEHRFTSRVAPRYCTILPLLVRAFLLPMCGSSPSLFPLLCDRVVTVNFPSSLQRSKRVGFLLLSLIRGNRREQSRGHLQVYGSPTQINSAHSVSSNPKSCHLIAILPPSTSTWAIVWPRIRQYEPYLIDDTY